MEAQNNETELLSSLAFSAFACLGDIEYKTRTVFAAWRVNSS